MTTSFVPASELGVLDAPEEILSTLTREGRRKWMYPVPSPGRYERRRRVLGWGLIALFVALPIIPVGGKPAVLLDVAHRAFTFFGFTFYPTDTFLLLLFGIALLVAVALLTALLGRVWCGWGCPQTVYLEFVYRPIERWIEGKEHVRARRDRGPWTLDKAWRKAAKWGVYALISVALAHVFVSYFAGWEALLRWMQGSPLDHWGFFVLMAGTSALVLFNFGVFREQMCTIACPYARFQSVLMDQDSLIVSYDYTRGEPRGKGKKRDAGPDGRPLGDCIDCFACVRTCPTGIDIRDGLQMECIACTQCIDACDAIMDKIDKPRGLIRYTSERALEGLPTRVLRPRTVLYGALLVAVAALFTIALTTRGAYDVEVGRSTGAPFMALPDGTIANRLHFRVQSQTSEPVTFSVEAVTPEGASLRVGGRQPIALAPQAMERLDAFAVVPREAFAGAQQLEGTFRVVFSDGHEETLTFPLLGPSR